MKILLVGDIVGSPGRRIFKKTVARLRSAGSVHAVIANAENAAAGNGLTIALAEELFDAGADVITLGDHAWGQKELEQTIGREKRIVRPANFAPGCPGQGATTVQTPLGQISVINLVGRVFMGPYDCPFRTADVLLKSMPGGVPIIVDFHAEATSEKIALGRYLDGRVTVVAGSHTHVQTSDARILSNGTAYITDLGMTGPYEGVIGREDTPVLHKFLTGMSTRFEVAKGLAVLEGAIVELDPKSRKAVGITAIRECETAES
jgi:hypothetical protein